MKENQDKSPEAIKIDVTIQPTEYKNVFGSVPTKSISGSGWVADAKQLMQCGIPFIGESHDLSGMETNRNLDGMLEALGIPSTDGKFLVIVTNMHVVSGFRAGSYSIRDSAIAYKAKILVKFPDRDLALLLPDPASLQHLIPYQVSTEYIKQGEELVAHGYANGKQHCVSKGQLKRIMRISYVYSMQELLAYEMTSPINPGDSGGPVLNAAGQVVAVTHQCVSHAQAQSNAIPITELICAMRAYVRGGRDVVLALPINTTKLLNPCQRRFYKIEQNVEQNGRGVLVNNISKLYESPFLLGDILVSIQGVPISAEGMVDYGGIEAVPFDSMLEFFQLGDKVSIGVIRAGIAMDVTVTLTTPLHSLSIVPTLPPEGAPHAFYRHGFGFIELTKGVSRAYTTSTVNMTPLSLYHGLQSGQLFKSPEHQGKCYVSVMSPSVEGYTNSSTLQCVTHINRKPVRDIWHVQQIFDSMKDDEQFVLVHCDNSVEPNYILPKLELEDEKKNRELFSIPDRYYSLPQSESSKKRWQLIRDKFSCKFFRASAAITSSLREETVLENEPRLPQTP